MSSRRTPWIARLTLVGLTGGIGCLWTPLALAHADLAALGLQEQQGQLQLILTWQGDPPSPPQIRTLSDHQLVLQFPQVQINPSAYAFPTAFPELGIRNVRWSQQGSMGQIEIWTDFVLDPSLDSPLQLHRAASAGDSSETQVQIMLDLQELRAQAIPSFDDPDETLAAAIAAERAHLEDLLQQIRQTAIQEATPVAEQSPSSDQELSSVEASVVHHAVPANLDPMAPDPEPLALDLPVTQDPPLDPPLHSPSPALHPKLSDLSIPFSTTPQHPLIAQSQTQTTSDMATGFMSRIDSRTSAFTSELTKLEDQLRTIRWNFLQGQQPPPDPSESEELVILTPSLSYEQKPSPPDLVDLYGSDPPPPQDLVDLYGSSPESEPESSSRSPQTTPLSSPSVAQIPDADDPLDLSPTPPPIDAPTVVNIPTSHTVGALSTDRGFPRISSANGLFTQFRSLNGAIGGIVFSRTDREGETNIAEITPENRVPIQFQYRDQGLGIDASTVDRTLLTTTTLFDSTIFDFQLAGFGAFQGSIPGCTNIAEGPWTVVTPDSILIDPETGEEIFAPIAGDLLNPTQPSLGGASIDDVCRQVSNEVVAEVLADPENLVNNPNALIFDIDNVEIVDTESPISSSSTTESTFTTIPHYWTFEQQDWVGEIQTGSTSILRQWFIDPRADLGTTLAGLLGATFLPDLDPEAEIEGTPAQGVLELNEVTLQGRDVLSGLAGRSNDEFRSAWSTYQILGDNADIAADQFRVFPVRGFGYEFGAVETARVSRQDFSTFFTATSDEETFVEVAVAGGGAGISVSNPEEGIDFFLSGDQPNTAVAVQIEVLQTLGFNTLITEEEIENRPALAFNYGHTRLGERSRLVIRPSIQYAPEEGELGLAFGGSYQAQVGNLSYTLNGRYHTNDLFSYDGVISTLALPVVNQSNTAWTLFSSQSVDTREDVSSVVFGTQFRLGTTTLGLTYRPDLINDLTLTALSWVQSWNSQLTSELRLVDSTQGTGLTAEARQELGLNRDIVLRASTFDGETQGILGDLQGTEISSAEFSIEARF